MPAGLTKNFREAAKNIVKYLEDPITTERQESLGSDAKQETIEVVGLYKHFDFMELDQYEWKLKFVFRDTEPKTKEASAFRVEMALNNPEHAALFTTITAMIVFKEVTKQVIIKIDGKVVSADTSKDWIDFTREWIKRLQRNDSIGEF